jgi:myo-inositol-1(or 4)-monophosphatase
MAAGRYDGFFETGLKSWDIAAGCLLVTEAGGLVSDLGGENGYVKTGHICAGNPDIHGHLLKLIAPHLTDGLKATKA